MSTVTTHLTARRSAELNQLATTGLPVGLIALLLVCAALVVGGVALTTPLVAIAAGLIACAVTTAHAFSLLTR
ncbi:hypothetical protein [Raineyella fluvialis]|uniref:Uncharacterized protein n=1 Tax=Raineyella fluvialis TaxID=2662261 RepID=A0A5Q2FE19_9ACTN|nr:hypothetical protein [Raineyella fluvialis]QGF22975.1 hypothetical protein Rai3103_04040 [Raineyella fluvialis]